LDPDAEVEPEENAEKGHADEEPLGDQEPRDI